jgi:hypothetical protein
MESMAAQEVRLDLQIKGAVPKLRFRTQPLLRSIVYITAKHVGANLLPVQVLVAVQVFLGIIGFDINGVIL